MRVRFYVDGLNFYYNVANAINFKWLDLERCLRRALEKHLRTNIDVECIKFYSSPVFGDANSRQKIYHRALQLHSPCIEIHLGIFKKYTKKGELKNDCPHCGQGKGDTAETIVRIEKQTDVNIGVTIVDDAYTASGEYDIACLVSNDSDLSAALAVKKKLGQQAILMPPIVQRDDPNIAISKAPAKKLVDELLNHRRDCIPHFFENEVRQCALPNTVSKFTIPREWTIK